MASRSHSSIVWVALALVGTGLACGQTGGALERRTEVAEAQPTTEASEQANAEGGERTRAELEPEPSAASEAPTKHPPIYEQLMTRVTGGATPSAESESEAWTHYKAKDYEQAQIAFALASLHDGEAWKHPFNLACVSARLQDEGMVRVGLNEAMARDPEATATKARADADLSAYRSAPWWEATVGPSPPRGSSDDELEIPTDAELVGPKLAEPHILPAGRHTPLDPERLELVRAKLMEIHGLYPQLRGSLEFSDEAGVLHAYVVYDYSVLDGCMLKRHKQVCFAEWGEDREEGGGWDMTHCVRACITRLTFAPGGKLEADERYLSFGCGPANVYRLDLVDADGDGADEVVIDIRSRGVVLGRRYTKDYLMGRVFEVHRLDGTPQFAFEHDLRTFSIMDTPELFRRVVAKDLNKDGYIDFVIQAREIGANAKYPVDAEFWPVLSDAGYRVVGALKTEVRHYKPGKDRW